MTIASREELREMPLFDHLDELRKRLMWTLGVVLFAAFACMAIAPMLFEWLQTPLRDITDQQLQVLDPIEMFVIYLKLALFASLFISAPWILLQIWLFVAPGLYTTEKRWVVPFIVLGTLFFVGGGAFGFYIVIPNAFEFLTGLVPDNVEANYAVERYFALVTKLLLGFGIVFELPLAMWILSAAQIVDPALYARFRKYWAVCAVVLGALLTDPSPMTQAMMAAPLIVFWELGIIGGKLLYRRSHEDR